MSGHRRLVLVAMIPALLLGGAAPTAAQVMNESRILREASARESRGDFEAAEQLLREILGHDPTSSGALFALERVLRAQGRTEEILPAADRFLSEDPSASGVRHLKLRALVDVDSLDALAAEAEAWFAADPDAEATYRDVSRIWERAFGTEAALGVLRRGRDRLDRDDAFALEIGDLFAPVDPGQAVVEWMRAVRDDGSGANAAARRIAGLPDRGGEAARSAVATLGRSDLLQTRRAAAEIALTLGFETEAQGLSEEVASDLEGRARASFLTDVARRARDGGLPSVATWAYRELGSEASTPAERRRFDERMVEASLAEGDTLAALEAQQRLVSSYSPGSADRRQATAFAIHLESGRADPDRLVELMETFRDDFPGAPELDEIAATVASALMGRGDTGRAVGALEGVAGPRSSIERGYLFMSDGDLDGARTALLAAVDGLSPSDATHVIQLTSLLGRVSPGAATLLADAAVLAHTGRWAEAAGSISEGLDAVPGEERPALLGEAARMAERGGGRAEAAGLRRALLGEFPDAPEAADAALALARYLGRTPDGVAEAISLLESLVTGRPDAALVPDARRELERLRGRGER